VPGVGILRAMKVVLRKSETTVVKNLLFLSALVFVMLGCSSCAGVSSAAGGNDGAELTAVIDAVREAIVEAEIHDVKGFPALKAIVVKLQTTVSRSAGGQVRYLVVAVGGGVSSETSSTLELDMKPPEIPKVRTLLSTETLKETLAQAIHLAKIGVAQAAKGEPPLPMKSVGIELKFTVAVEGSAGAKVLLLPLGLEASGKIARGRVHTIKLDFGP
jgi:Trypsin-co-occurring domain 2